MSTSERSGPPYCRPELFFERELVVGEGDWALPGTLSCPKSSGKVPGVVLVHGSGPQDRDETIGPNKVFRDLAWGLASAGIAVLRYEKRTRRHGEKMVPIIDGLTVKEETVDDAVAALSVLKAVPEVDPERVFLAGHSLGGYLAPRIALRDRRIAGIISLAGCTRPIDVLHEEQVAYLLSGPGAYVPGRDALLKQVSAQLARVRDPELRPGFDRSQLPLRLPASWWLDLRGYDPAVTAAGLAVAMLVLQGERDFQVTMADFEGWKRALSGRQDVTFKSYPTLNHMFIEGEGESRPDEYDRPGYVAASVVEDIAGWIQSLPHAPAPAVGAASFSTVHAKETP